MEHETVTFEDVERRLTTMHRDAYYPWVRHVVTLASGALTVLVSLQNNYVPENPHGLSLLILCWVGLFLSISMGVVALYGEAQTPLDAAQNIRRMRKKYGDDLAAKHLENNSAANPRKSFLLAQKALPLAFVGSLCCLCLFAILNLPY